MIIKSLPLLLLAYLAQAAEWPARIDWSGRVTLAVPVSGVVESVAAQAGQSVKKGDLLASLKALPFKAGVAEARADADRYGEEEADARRDLERVKELYARTVSTTTELDAARLRLARATSSLAAAQARLERARWQLSESELRAPFDLVVLTRHAEPGLVVASQCQPTALFSVARSDEWLARALVEGTSPARLRPGAAAEVSVGERIHKGRIQALSTQGDGRWTVDVALPAAADLSAGSPATMRLP